MFFFHPKPLTFILKCEELACPRKNELAYCIRQKTSKASLRLEGSALYFLPMRMDTTGRLTPRCVCHPNERKRSPTY